ncbi:hypothetical protein GCM10009799_33010 [Nocardiopsis rhodophaea]|uniref:Knr4/Smi1-like domain-containing protein n=1 Tax=Nocardiopsis rhodophaea TaxID=280238 RepID=A0ABP5ES77_9ACTN
MSKTTAKRIIDQLLGHELIQEMENLSEIIFTSDFAEAARRDSECPPPGMYLDYLEEVSKFDGPSYFPVILSLGAHEDANETAQELSQDYPEFTTSDKFFFSEHQGYIVWYFKKTDPAVYRFGEDTEIEERIANSFEEFIEDMIEYAVRHRERMQRFHERVSERYRRRHLQ